MDNIYDILFHKGSMREAEDYKISDMVGLVQLVLDNKAPMIDPPTSYIINYSQRQNSDDFAKVTARLSFTHMYAHARYHRSKPFP